MKYILYVILVVVLLFAGYVIADKILEFKDKLSGGVFEHNEKIKLPQITVIDTVVQTETVTIHHTDTVYVEAEIEPDSIDNTIATAIYTPSNPYVSGEVNIKYSYTSQLFKIIDDLKVKQNTEYVTVTQTLKVDKPPKFISPSIIAGYLVGEEEGVVALGAGVSIKERLNIYLTAASSKKVGIQISYQL